MADRLRQGNTASSKQANRRRVGAPTTPGYEPEAALLDPERVLNPGLKTEGRIERHEFDVAGAAAKPPSSDLDLACERDQAARSSVPPGPKPQRQGQQEEQRSDRVDRNVDRRGARAVRPAVTRLSGQSFCFPSEA